MRKKIKIIDLLNKIANGEIELGTKFIWQHIDENIILIFMKRYGAIGLYFEEGTMPDGEIRWIGLFGRYNYQILNDEVEILDEEDEFEDIEIKEMELIGVSDIFEGNEKYWTKVITKNLEYLYKNQCDLIKNQEKIIERLKDE